MALEFNANTDNVDFGNIASFDSLTAITIACLVNVHNVAAGHVVSMWGSAIEQQQFTIISDSQDLTWAIHNASGGATYSIQHSTSDFLVTDTWVQLVCTWATPNTMQVFGDGASISMTVDNAGSPPSTHIGNGSFRFGAHTGGGNGCIMSLADVGLWNRVLASGEIAALGKRYSPRFFPRGLLFASDNIRDARNRLGLAATPTSIDVSDHPRMIYPTEPRRVTAPPAGHGALLAGYRHRLVIA